MPPLTFFFGFRSFNLTAGLAFLTAGLAFAFMGGDSYLDALLLAPENAEFGACAIGLQEFQCGRSAADLTPAGENDASLS